MHLQCQMGYNTFNTLNLHTSFLLDWRTKGSLLHLKHYGGSENNLRVQTISSLTEITSQYDRLVCIKEPDCYQDSSDNEQVK